MQVEYYLRYLLGSTNTFGSELDFWVIARVHANAGERMY
jgi:hypothetical protein